ncbi:MAG: LLM class F420-dependent oxidoreductase [Acidimicrobiia bacterium]|nr:LLM class F420-dependent oxidoreductase [Acidimicrobiia bacterium]MDH4305875.1 LLM class F420-dependent oxidoreductase [Acidimicrobiia bacterium]MDH5292269.1 LLM class F420-dependent oxidoreductase [Acidimicrobiia bacterium]
MEFGVSIFATDTTIDPVTVAKAAEDRGFDSLWLPEHSHIPASRETPWGGVAGAPPLPEHYWRTLDTFVALGAAAAATDRLKLATGITLLAQRDPIWTAKEVATVDHLSGGRFIFGIGYGWNKEELASHGVSYTERRALMREKIHVMKALWTDDVASYAGEKLHLEPSWAWPKPIQKPHPPIVLGGAIGPRTLADIVEFCDGWFPLGRYDLEEGTRAVRQALTDAGRDDSAFEFSYFHARPSDDFIGHLSTLGFSRAVFGLPQGDASEVMASLDELARFAARMK